jgi:uncharacterized RDD family membrane protein YckC
MPTENVHTPVILGRYAGFFSRWAAFVLDRFIAFGIAFVILLVLDYFANLFHFEEWLESLSQRAMVTAALALVVLTLGIYLLVSTVYDIGFWLLSGQTPGKRVLGVRVMRADGTRLKLGNALVREVGYWVSAISFLGFIWILFDNRRQGFHDKLAGTIVTYSWPEGRLRGTFVIERVQRFTDRGSST